MDYGLIGTVLSLIVPACGGLVWLVRLEGKINVQDARQIATDKRVDGIEDRIVAQLDRIEVRLDSIARDTNSNTNSISRAAAR